MKYIFGPVTSRRLGRSLGIDLFPTKICNFNCVYCEVGASQVLYHQRKQYSPTKDILKEISSAFENGSLQEHIDVCTLTARGEPTLHSDFGPILSHLKHVSTKPVIVLTNSSTMHSPAVRESFTPADIVIPSLDAVTPAVFQHVDRAHKNVKVEQIIEGLITFSHQFTGKLWLELLFVKGINDSPGELKALAQVIGAMRVDRVQLNTVFRPPASSSARPVSSDALQHIARTLTQQLALPVDLPAPSSRVEAPAEPEPESIKVLSLPDGIDGILHAIQRRPCTAADISRTYDIGSSDKVKQLLAPLVQEGTIRTYNYQGNRFYQYVQSVSK
ncbi:MAG: radical SAM protein [Desulfobulbus propionicus]|nr:MAG: radical SAM protein [Desulfobulbus propionicus]